MCRLRDIYRAISEVESHMEAAFGLNLNEAMLLCQLSENANMTAGEISERLGLTQSNASKVIRSLERKKLLQRSFDRMDKRVMHYQLTKTGKEKLQEVDCEHLTFPPLLQKVIEE